METRDFKVLADLGSALWADPHRARITALDIVATVGLQNLTRDARVERAARALLDAATRAETTTNSDSKHEPFYRLSPEERLTLAALYHGHWSYRRLARVLSLTVDQVQELAWGARMYLATAPTGRSYVPHPVGSGGPSCPEYAPGRPWTQKFLDEEMTTQERTFIQMHAERCTPCQQALSRARQLYYAVLASVPALDSARSMTVVSQLGETFNDALKFIERDRTTFFDSLEPLVKRWDIRLLLAALFLFFVAQFYFS